MGKLLLAILFSSASAAFAVHEARPPTPPPTRVTGPPRPDRVNVAESPDPSRFARPFYIRPIAPAPHAPPPQAPPPHERAIIREEPETDADEPAELAQPAEIDQSEVMDVRRALRADLIE